MTITAEPPSRTLPQYNQQPFQTSHSPLTSRLSVADTMTARMTGGVPITRDLVAAMLAEEVEQTLEDTGPEQRRQVTAARDILERGCQGEEFPSFVTSYGYSHYLSGRP